MKEAVFSWITDLKKMYPNLNYNTIDYIAVDLNGNIESSSYPDILRKAEYGIIIVHYSYRVVTQYDNSCFVGFIDKNNGIVKDQLQINNWSIAFDEPFINSYRTDGRLCVIKKDNLYFDYYWESYRVKETFNTIWDIFLLIQNCTTQEEISLIKKICHKNDEIAKLKNENWELWKEKERLSQLEKTYQNLILKIESLIQ